MNSERLPSWRPSAILAAGLSLAVGWGIRGNFGHEYGAAFAGCLAVMAACLLSGREDWRQRIAYFAFFGAVGWGFGGSISYMQVISYTHSGHWPSQLYGFFALWWIGFLWAAIGCAGAALPAVADIDRLTRFFGPILAVFIPWAILPFVIEPLAVVLRPDTAGIDPTWERQKSPLYWFDSDYLQALFALFGLWLYDLWSRRAEANIFLAPLFALGGALLGGAIQYAMAAAGILDAFARAMTYVLGDPTAISPETGAVIGTENLLNNWPQWFGDYPQHVGWIIGLILGLSAYFLAFGKFRNGASLFVYMAAGWILCFLAFPVLLSIPIEKYIGIGGFRMTPPRSDDWAGITGVFIGMTIWLLRNGLPQVAYASAVGGFIGGAGFSGITWLKLMMVAPGNESKLNYMAAAGGIDKQAAADQIALWRDWQSQNWHSFLEQSYGFVNGIAVAVALGLLASRIKPLDDSARPRRWTEAFAAFITLIGITYVNLYKNVAEWASRGGVWVRQIEINGETLTLPALWKVPYLGHLPGMDGLALTPAGWFNVTYLAFAVAFILLAWRHLRRPLAIVPRTGLGKGQLLYLILMWAMIIGNFERALTGWHPSRLLTEWVIFINGVICTLLVLLCAREHDEVPIAEPESYSPLLLRAWGKGLLAVFIGVFFFFGTVRGIYGDWWAGHSGADRASGPAAGQKRFGPEAGWRIKPILKNKQHR